MSKDISRLLSNVSWLTIGRLSTDVANLVLFIVISRYFGVIGVGQYAYAFGIAGIAGSIISLGFEDYSLRECSHLSIEKQKALICKLVGAQLYALCIVTGLIIGYLYITNASNELFTITIVLYVYNVAAVLSRPLFAPKLSRQEMGLPAFVEFLCNLIPAIASIVLIMFFDVSLATALMPLPVGMVGFLLVAYSSSLNIIGVVTPNFNIRLLFNLIKTTWPFAVSWFIFFFHARVGIVLLGVMVGDGAAGIFATAQKIVEVGSRLLYFVGIAVYPVLAKNFNVDDLQFKAALNRFLYLSLYAGLVFFWGLLFVAPPLIPMLFGEQFQPSSVVLQYMAVLGILISMDLAAYRILFSMHLQQKRIKIHFVGTVIILAVCALLIPYLDVYGCVIGSIVSYLAMNVMYLRILRNRKVTSHVVRTLFLFYTRALIGVVICLGIYAGFELEWLSALAGLVIIFSMLFIDWRNNRLVISK